VTETFPLHDLVGMVRPQLDRLNRELIQDLAPGHREMLPLVEHVGGFRGKQLRPVLTFLAGMAVRGATHGGGLGDDVVTVAKVVELLHTATLVHDDVLDSANVRRRIPTVNQMAGVEVAVLLGDYIYAKAFHMAVQLPDPTAARWLAETVRVICQGEITQVLHRFDFAWTEPRYFHGDRREDGEPLRGGVPPRWPLRRWARRPSARARRVRSRTRHRVPDRRRLPRPRRRRTCGRQVARHRPGEGQDHACRCST
jgi:hypothetical protein